MDLSLQPIGYVAVIPEATDKILHLMSENEGELLLTDKSSPEEIYAKLEMSKKNFKKAVGRLFREKKILILEDRLVRNDD
jgi:predicted RNA-binding protein (virulence factor B family)|nr:DNA-binding protein [Candidatus Kapabacteria bacterium]